MSKQPPLIIGIAGGTGSGKSTVAEKICEGLPPGSVSSSRPLVLPPPRNTYPSQPLPLMTDLDGWLSGLGLVKL